MSHVFGHSKKDLYDRARAVGVRAPETNHMERCDTCPRHQSVDMLMRYRGRYFCDGCWTDLRRKGRL